MKSRLIKPNKDIRPTEPETIARLADKGKDISAFFERGGMRRPPAQGDSKPPLTDKK